jgi:large subunit ribosomal protein L20
MYDSYILVLREDTIRHIHSGVGTRRCGLFFVLTESFLFQYAVRIDKEKYLMTRVKRGVVARKRRNKILELNRGFRGSHSTLFRTANQRSLKALSSSYSDRRKKKRQYRRLWIRRINAGSRSMGVTYSCFIHDLKKSTISLNRKMLSQLLILHPESFQMVAMGSGCDIRVAQLVAKE